MDARTVKSDRRVSLTIRAVAWAMAFAFGALLAAIVVDAHAQSGAAVVGAARSTAPLAERIVIPEIPPAWRIRLEREAGATFGVNAPTARLAAQIHQESRWRPKAASKYAQGLTQFTPATAKWLPAVCPGVGPPDVWDPDWAIRAMVCYDAHLAKHVGATATECDRWAMALAAYNGGLGWINRDRRLAAKAGKDPTRWFGHVSEHTGRAAWARKENRGYPHRILLVLEPAYARAGWSSPASCAT